MFMQSVIKIGALVQEEIGNMYTYKRYDDYSIIAYLKQQELN